LANANTYDVRYFLLCVVVARVVQDEEVIEWSEASAQILPILLRIWKIFTKRSLASEKSTKIAPKLQKFISFQPQLQI
jgi:hypothetical protein